jgi:hypothetical protein
LTRNPKRIRNLLEANENLLRLERGACLSEAVEDHFDVTHVVLERTIGGDEEVFDVRVRDSGRQAVEHAVDHPAER